MDRFRASGLDLSALPGEVYALNVMLGPLGLGRRTNLPYLGACERCEPFV